MKNVALLLLVLNISCCFETCPPDESIVLMSWNVQNLFDGSDNGDEYSEYSVADGLWSEKLYHRRLKALSKIIHLNKPDIVAFQEIEGEGVLLDFKEKYLKEYKYIAATCTDSAIELGFISKLPIKKVGYIDPNNSSYDLRPLLEVTFIVGGRDLIVINNHWKSKRGGFTENFRLESARALKKRLKLLADKEVVVLGDLNENYNEYQRVHKSYGTALLFEDYGEGITIRNSRIYKSDSLYSPWPDSVFPGSYFYRGEWETIDHVLLNKELMDKEGFLFKSFYVDSREELVNDDRRINSWDKEHGLGYSDHLPLVVKLGLPGVETTLE